mmetsp:Transcript_22796/g.67846  ORF Transcript_22796/g.67846 Transcript_22796/m.67846 type:complete len:261 (+) Transcript_22796:484-1266(+)
MERQSRATGDVGGEHAPGEALPLLVAGDLRVAPGEAHRQNEFEDGGPVHEPRRQGEGVDRLSGGGGHGVRAEAADAAEEGRVGLGAEQRDAGGDGQDDGREPEVRDVLGAGVVGSLGVALEGPAEAQHQEDVRAGEEGLRGAVQPVRVRQNHAERALGDDAARDRGNHEEQQESEAVLHEGRRVVALVREEVQKDQVRQQGRLEQDAVDVLALVRKTGQERGVEKTPRLGGLHAARGREGLHGPKLHPLAQPGRPLDRRP